jgi:beta-glucanase (GH16 family)
LLKRLVATGAGLALAWAAAACGTGSSVQDDAVLNVPGPSVAVTGSPSASGPAAAPGIQQLGDAAYATSAPAPSATSAKPPAPANPAGWGDPVFVDDFNGGLSSVWGRYDTPDGTPPRSGDQVSVSGGQLHIAGNVNNRVGKDVGGGVMLLKDYKYGRFEVRFRVQAGAGYSSVVLLWPKDNADWPTVGEIDIAEITNPGRASFGSFLHHGQDNHMVGTDTKADFTTFHTVAVDWLPNRVTYYLDGKKVYNVTPGQIETGLPTESAMHLALQLDQGCDDFIPCRTSATPDKVVMDVDWVKVYKAS